MNAILLTKDMGELMRNAGLNTLLGMGTVFIVLIIIMLVISSFNLIGKNKKNEKAEPKSGVDKAVEQIAKGEEINENDDTELVAVISAAIAAYEGSSNGSGYVVRSIRRIR